MKPPQLLKKAKTTTAAEMSMIKRNGLELPLNDSHVYQRRGITIAYRNKSPLHFTVLRCKDGGCYKTYFGLAEVDNIQDFEAIIDHGDKFEGVFEWFKAQECSK